MANRPSLVRGLGWHVAVGPVQRGALVVLLLFGAAAACAANVAPPNCWLGEQRPRVLIAYVSDTGYTRTLANAVRDGAAPHACVWSLDVSHADVDMLADADAIVLGTPVQNGNPAAPLLAWIARWPFRGQPLANRLGAAFVTAGGYHAGAESSVLALHRSLLSFGMIVVGGEQWQAAYGVAATTNEAPFENRAIDAAFIGKAQQLGARIATLAARWQRPPPNPPTRSTN